MMEMEVVEDYKVRGRKLAGELASRQHKKFVESFEKERWSGGRVPLNHTRTYLLFNVTQAFIMVTLCGRAKRSKIG
jgi:hypothetical protein